MGTHEHRASNVGHEVTGVHLRSFQRAGGLLWARRSGGTGRGVVPPFSSRFDSSSCVYISINASIYPTVWYKKWDYIFLYTLGEA